MVQPRPRRRNRIRRVEHRLSLVDQPARPRRPLKPLGLTDAPAVPVMHGRLKLNAIVSRSQPKLAPSSASDPAIQPTAGRDDQPRAQLPRAAHPAAGRPAPQTPRNAPSPASQHARLRREARPRPSRNSAVPSEDQTPEPVAPTPLPSGSNRRCPAASMPLRAWSFRRAARSPLTGYAEPRSEPQPRRVCVSQKVPSGEGNGCGADPEAHGLMPTPRCIDAPESCASGARGYRRSALARAASRRALRGALHAPLAG